MSNAPWVGRAKPRREDARFLRGEAKYLDDLARAGQLHAAFARSPFAHARIAGIDTGEALASPGVIAVLTGAELEDVGPLPSGSIEDGVVADAGHPVLARGTARYVGEPLALVVAETRAQAEDAAELVLPELDPLDPVLDPRAAAESGAVLASWFCSHGDVEGTFASAARVVSSTTSIPRLVAAPLEPRGALAEYDREADLLTVTCSAQDPHRPLAQLAHALHRERNRTRVVLPDVGGAFGSKGAIAPEVVAVAAAAIRLGRPVKWAEDRLENFLAAYQGRGVEVDAELAVAEDGRFLALRARIFADLGAYLYPTTAVPPHTTAMLLTGAYALPVAEVEVTGAATNKPPTGPYRGAGRPEAAFVIERLVELAARELDLDPVDVRRRNFVAREAFPYRTPFGWIYDSGDFERCLERAVDLFDLPRWREERRRASADGRLVGVGFGMVIERCGGVWESARVAVEADGRVVVTTGSSPHGQGHETTFAQIAADELGVEPDAVELRWRDSGDGPAGIGTFASRSVAMGGSALVKAAQEIRERARGHAERLLAGRVAWDGRAFANDGARVTLAEIAAAVGRLEAETRFESGLLFASGAYAAAVEIERATGRLRVLALAAADDPGRVVNPLLAEGQVVGAIAQGLGQCLTEEAVYDEDGQLRTASFADYKLLTAAEVPPLATAFVETPSPLNPLGAKGVGEAGAIGAPAAIANAVADALRFPVDPPFTAEKLWLAVNGGEG
ncbi:MAG: xanthine dehydrogenase family protein molybdopterin-binding subunit [Actinomycetota bacterium]|nr:xanthine dehydrogenase family protein molybdopterin-binding subunit [Actinomycetota bacterium]